MCRFIPHIFLLLIYVSIFNAGIMLCFILIYCFPSSCFPSSTLPSFSSFSFFEMRSWISILAQPLRAKIILFYFLHYYVQLICDICIYIYVYIHTMYIYVFIYIYTMYIYVYVLVAIMKSIIWFFLGGEGSSHCIQKYYWLLYVEFHILQFNWVNLFVLIELFFFWWGGEGIVPRVFYIWGPVIKKHRVALLFNVYPFISVT